MGIGGSPPERFRLGHRPELDGLRGVAILSVLVYHTINNRLHLPIFSGGYLGVDLFFVLSGFLITTILLEEWGRSGTVSLRMFYLRRVLRLAPAYVSLLLVVLGLELLLLRAGPRFEQETRQTFQAIPATLFYVSNWVRTFEIFPLRSLSITWSLAIEEQFYLLWPVSLLWGLRRGWSPKRLLAVTLSLMAASMALRFGLHLNGQPWDRSYYGTDARVGELLAGCALGIVATSGWLPAASRWLRLSTQTGMLLVGVLVLVSPNPGIAGMWMHAAYPLLAILVAGGVISLLVDTGSLMAAVMRMAWLRWIGRISYGLYLWHSVLLYFVSLIWLGDTTLSVIVGMGMTMVVVIGSYYLIERPALKLKSRLRRSASISSPVPVGGGSD